MNGALGTVVDIVYTPTISPPDDLPVAVMVEFDRYTGPTLYRNTVPVKPLSRHWGKANTHVPCHVSKWDKPTIRSVIDDHLHVLLLIGLRIFNDKLIFVIFYRHSVVVLFFCNIPAVFNYTVIRGRNFPFRTIQ